MNREIKFRVWDKNVPKNESELDNPTGIMIGWDYVKDSSYLESLHSNDYPIMQFTGLKDRNSVEIYECDIVKINHPDDMTGDFTDAVGYVFYNVNEGAFFHTNNKGRPAKRMWDHVEVIGNIYQNPKLCK